MLLFDSANLLIELARLPPSNAARFALACAERTQRLSALPPESQILGVVERALRAAPSHHGREPELKVALEAIEASPHLDDDAVASACYAIRNILFGDPQDALWAAQRAYDAADARAQADLNITNYSPAIEAEILGSAVVQSELTQQTAEIERLRRHV